eukprot:14925736-Ditylum_brightwellii.AAC.1
MSCSAYMMSWSLVKGTLADAAMVWLWVGRQENHQGWVGAQSCGPFKPGRQHNPARPLLPPPNVDSRVDALRLVYETCLDIFNTRHIERHNFYIFEFPSGMF